jgi:hypothetical protein
MSTVAIEHPAWCDASECDADPSTGWGWHQARPMTVPHSDQSRSSASVLMFRAVAESRTWIRLDWHTVDVDGGPAEYTQLLAPEQARILGRHLLRAGGEAIG